MTLVQEVLARPEMSAGVLTFLLWHLAKATLLLGLAYIIIGIFRRATSATHHLVLCTAVMAALVIPAISLCLPSWKFALPGPLATAWPAESFVGGHTLPVLSGRVAEPGILVPWTAWAIGIWLFGTLSLLARIGFGVIGTWRIARKARPVKDLPLTAQLDELRSRLDIRRPVTMATSTEVASPLTWGIFRPLIIVPEHALGWSERDLRMVLLHELAHVRRHDVVWFMAATVVTAMYWVNPLAWIARKRLIIEAEKTCDDYVIGCGTDGIAYAQHLLTVLRSIRDDRRTVFVSVGMARRSHMEGRLMSILSNRKRASGLRRPALVWAAMLTLLVVLPMAGVQLKASETGRSSDAAETTEAQFPSPDSLIEVDTEPEMIYQSTPEYPEKAKKAGIAGDVWIRALITAEGKVHNAIVYKSSGEEILDKSAHKAAYGCKYSPATRDDKPVATWVTYKVSFVLDGKEEKSDG